MNVNYKYCMVGNFRCVLVFVVFVVDLAVTKVFHPRKLMLTMIWLCESMMMGMPWPQTLLAVRPILPMES